MAWGKLTTKTLTVTAADIQTDVFTPNTFMSMITHAIRSTVSNGRWQFGSTTIDTGANYASRREIDGGTDIVAVSQNYIWYRGDSDEFSVGFMINIAGEEKLVMGNSIYVGSTTGAGYAPSRQKYTGKWSNTSNQCDIIESENGSGNLAADSNLSILGTD